MNIPLQRLRENATVPAYQTIGAAALDLCAAIDEPIILKPMDRHIVPTGFAIELPPGYEAQIRARSGLSSKHGICLANGIGTIDSDYRGEVGAILINLSHESFTVTPGMRVAQMVIVRYEQVSWRLVEALSSTDRGTDGYGSTKH